MGKYLNIARQVEQHSMQRMPSGTSAATFQEGRAVLDASLDQPPLRIVGRDGAPCPVCGKTWQWPTTANTWVCSWCFVQGRHVIREA